MESLVPSISISTPSNDGKVDEAFHEPLDSQLVPISAHKTLPVWQYFTMVKDRPITCNKIQYVYYCLLCLKKCPHKFLDNLVAIYNDTTSNAHKPITSRHLSLHLACKHQSLKPKQLISILTFASTSANNICAFIENGNDDVIEHVHMLIARMVVNCKASLLLATNVNLNEVIQATSYLKPRSYVPMTPGKFNRAFISMFSKFTVCVKALIVKVRTMYMLASYDELVDEYVSSSCGWLVVCHDGWDSVIKQFFSISMYWIDL
jgi:hypothetical protein